MVLERSRTGVSGVAPAVPATAVATSPEGLPHSDPAGSVTIALAQFYPKLGDVAANLAALRLVAAFARVNVIVAVALAAVHGDPDVLEQCAILVLKLRGMRRAHGEKRAVLLDL